MPRRMPSIQWLPGKAVHTSVCTVYLAKMGLSKRLSPAEMAGQNRAIRPSAIMS